MSKLSRVIAIVGRMAGSPRKRRDVTRARKVLGASVTRSSRKARARGTPAKAGTARARRAESSAPRADAAATQAAHWQHVRTALRDRGLLLLADARLPSVAGLVAGAPVRGSWWSHPSGRAIFAAASRLHDHPDVLACALLGGKVTFVHRRLWPALLTLAQSGERWQTQGLPPAARALLGRVQRGGDVEGAGPAARELERRLLVHGGEVHTPSGRHAKPL